MTETDDFLEHYGVKGMRWGVRKVASGISNATSSVRASVKDAVQRGKERRATTKAERKANYEGAKARGYSDRMRRADIEDVGIKRTRNIERRITSGEKIGPARFKERAASMAQGMAVGAAILATPIAIGATSQGLSKLSSNINAKRGAEAARKLFADSKGLTSYSTVALSFNAAKNSWE